MLRKLRWLPALLLLLLQFAPSTPQSPPHTAGTISSVSSPLQAIQSAVCAAPVEAQSVYVPSKFTDLSQSQNVMDGAVLGSWRKKPLVSGVQPTRRLIMVGDSTTDARAAGGPLYTRLADYQVAGGSLEGVVVTDFGSNGNTLSGWLGGSGRSTPTFTITGATAASPIVLTVSGTNTLTINDQVVVSGVAGLAGANGSWRVSAVTSSTVTLAGSTGTGSYTSSGTVAATAKLADLPADADLVMIRYGINDVRQGATSAAQLTALLVTAIDRIQAACPSATVCLCVPNSFASNDYNANGYVSPNSAAQAYTDILEQAYRAAWLLRPTCVFLDLQQEVFGRTCLVTPPAAFGTAVVTSLMSDQLHPSTQACVVIADYFAACFTVQGDQSPYNTTNHGVFSPFRSQAAHTEQFNTPWMRYGSAPLDTKYWTTLASGRVLSEGVNDGSSNYLDLQSAYSGLPATGYLTQIIAGYDLIVFPSWGYILYAGQNTSNSQGFLRIFLNNTLALPPVGTPFSLCRSRYINDMQAFTSLLDTTTNQYQRFGNVAALSGDGSYIDIAARPGQPVAATWLALSTDTLKIMSISAISLSTATFTANADGTLRITKTAGAFFTGGISAWPVVLYGPHNDESKPYSANVTANYTAPSGPSSVFINVNATSAPPTITLPPAGLALSNTVTILKNDASVNAVTVVPSSVSLTISGVTNTSPIVITTSGNGLAANTNSLQTGATVTISGVGGTTAANGTWTITRLSRNTFSLVGSTGNATYTSGGSVSATQTINGASSQTILTQYSKMVFVSDGINWYLK